MTCSSEHASKALAYALPLPCMLSRSQRGGWKRVAASAESQTPHSLQHATPGLTSGFHACRTTSDELNAIDLLDAGPVSRQIAGCMLS